MILKIGRKNNINTLLLHFKKSIYILFEKYKIYVYSYIIIILGLILISTYIYIRFLRTRLPRDIPFKITLYMLIVLVVLCTMYLYTIKMLIKPTISHVIAPTLRDYITKPISYIRSVLETLDSTIKNNSKIKPYYIKLVNYFIPTILEFGSIERIFLAYCFMLIPSYILLCILMVDVFWLHQIRIFYYFLFLGMLPIIYSYYKYCLLVIKEDYLTFLESLYTSVKIYDENYDYTAKFDSFNPKAIYHQKEVSLREYFDIQLKHADLEYPEYKEENPESYEIIYVGYPSSWEKCYDEYRIKHSKTNVELIWDDYTKMHEVFNMIEPKLLGLMEYIDLDKYTYDLAYIKQLRIVLYSLYFITWFYILIKSIPTLSIHEMLKLLTLLTPNIQNIDPFVNP